MKVKKYMNGYMEHHIEIAGVNCVTTSQQIKKFDRSILIYLNLDIRHLPDKFFKNHREVFPIADLTT